jgi:eukaryotic-like serine/threonine-protein kinase
MAIPYGALIADRYRILRLLGEGGFGAVYLAEDKRLGNKHVALKENFDRSPEAQAQFRLEAQLLANLDHSGLPRVTDHFIESDGHQYLIMDYVEGVDLHERVIATGLSLPDKDAASIMLQISEAVAYLHTRRPQPIIHRDIKPPNIKITSNNRAVLVDFGIAKLYHPHKGTAKVAKAVTPHFSPPEQYGGKTDARSDVYSLGATLYCLVCAEVPPDAMDRMVKGIGLQPPTRKNTAVHPALSQIIMQALDLNPTQRYPNANHLTAALRVFLEGQPGESESATGPRIQCPSCGWLNRPGARFCSKDRTSLVSRSSPGAPLVEQMPPEVQFEVANAYARSDEYAQAIPRYRACLRGGFEDQAVYHNLGLCYRLADQAANAVHFLEQGAAQYPQDAEIQFQLALAYRQDDCLSEAITCIRKACKLSPKDAVNLRVYGQLLFEAKRYNDAVHQLGKAIRLDPDSASSQLWLGRSLGEKGDIKQAVRALQRAAQLDSREPEPLLWMGLVHHMDKNYSSAVSAFQSALRRDPALAPAHYMLGEAYLQQEKFQQALPCFQKAVVLDSSSAQFCTRLGLCYALMDRKPEAVTALRRALGIDPAHQQARELLSKI